MSQFRILTTKELFDILDKYTFKQLHIHHTWEPSHDNFTGTNHIYLQENMKHYHVNVRNFSDIAQHVTLTQDGLWVTGRDFSKSPASIKGWNTGSFAVEMLGNFDIGNDVLENEQRESILVLIKYFITKYGEESIKFHREGPGVAKTCPGTSLNKNELILEAKILEQIFKDVDDHRWSYKWIKAVKELGLMTGDSKGNFNPTFPLTREEAAVVLVRIYEKITGEKLVD